MSELDSLPPEMEELLAAERRRPGPSVELRNQLWSGVSKGLGGAVAASAAAKVATAKLVMVAVVAFGLGTGVGVIADRRLSAVPGPVPTAVLPPPTPVEAAPPLPPPIAPTSVSTPPPARPLEQRQPPRVATPRPVVVPPAPATSAPAPEPGPPNAHDAELAAERAQLERARTALARGRPSEAYQATLEYDLAYPSGQLAEEGQVLEIEALMALGRGDEARSLAARFRSRFPNSLLLPAVSRAVGR